MKRRSSWGGGGNPLRNASPRVAGRDTPASDRPDAAVGRDVPPGPPHRAAFAGLHAAEARVAEPLWAGLARALGSAWPLSELRGRAGDRLASGWVRAHGVEIASGRAALEVLLVVLPDDLAHPRALVAHALGLDAAGACLRAAGAAPLSPAVLAHARAQLDVENIAPAEACRRHFAGPAAPIPVTEPTRKAPAAAAPTLRWVDRLLEGLVDAAERAALTLAPTSPLVPVFRDAGAGRARVPPLLLPCGDARVHVAGAAEAGALVLRVVALDAAGTGCPGVEVSVGPVEGPRARGITDAHGVVTGLRCEEVGAAGALWELRAQAGPHLALLRWASPGPPAGVRGPAGPAPV